MIQSLKKSRPLVPKMTWRIWWILIRTVESLNFAFWYATFVESILCLSQKKYRGVMCDNTKEWCKVLRGTNLCFEKWREEFGKSWCNTQYLPFNGLIMMKVYNVWAKNVQRTYLSLLWRLMQTLKEKLLVIS